MIALGDYVTIGKSKLTWKVLQIREDRGTVVLQSGQTDRRRLEYQENLTLHSKGDTQ